MKNSFWSQLVYKNPGTPLLTADLDNIVNSVQTTIIAAELNAKHQAWNSKSTNMAGRTRGDTRKGFFLKVKLTKSKKISIIIVLKIMTNNEYRSSVKMT